MQTFAISVLCSQARRSVLDRWNYAKKSREKASGLSWRIAFELSQYSVSIRYWDTWIFPHLSAIIPLQYKIEQ